METLSTKLAENFRIVEDKICDSCARSGRERSEITLIAVSKTVDADMVLAALALGQHDFGENYVKNAQSKLEEIRTRGCMDARFHMIGHLQRNKVKTALPVFDSLHSLDSKRLLDSLENQLDGIENKFPCFVEVNVSGEESKYGISPEKAFELVNAADDKKHVNVVGLMTMAPFLAEPEQCRPYFARLRELRESINEKMHNPALRFLSMGMTNDFEVAIEEGATHLRIGTALFKT